MSAAAFGVLVVLAAPWPTPPRTCMRANGTSSTPQCTAPTATADVLVIGGTGFMGAPTAKLLHDQGRSVMVLSRGCENTGKGFAGRRPELPSGVTVISCDRKDSGFAALLTSTTCPRIIIDFQAYTVEQLEVIIKAHRERPLKQYIYISTNYVYPGGPEAIGVQDLPQPIAEQAAEPLSRVFALSNKSFNGYGGGKLQCEARLRGAAAQEGFPSLILRPPAAVGPRCDSRHERLQRLLAGLPPFGNGAARHATPHPQHEPPTRTPRRFRVAFSGDVAAATSLGISALERGVVQPGEAFNVASGEPVTLDEYAAVVARALGVKAQDVSRDGALTRSTPELPMKPTDYDLQGVLDTSKAERVLGFRPTSTEAFVKETVDWHRVAISAAIEEEGTLPPSWRPMHSGKRGSTSATQASRLAEERQQGRVFGPGDAAAAVLKRGDMYVESSFLPPQELQELGQLVSNPIVQRSVYLLDDTDRRLWKNSSFKFRVQSLTEGATHEDFLQSLLLSLSRKPGNAYVESKERQRYVQSHSRKLHRLNELAWKVVARAAERVQGLSFYSEVFDMHSRKLDPSYNIAFHGVGSDFPPHVDWAPNCVANLLYLNSEGTDFTGGELQTRGCPGAMDCPVTRNSFMGVYATLGRPENCSAGNVPLACTVLHEHTPRAGDLVVIPAESAHSVNMVTAGSRVAINFWLNCPTRPSMQDVVAEKQRRDAALGMCHVRQLQDAITRSTPA